MKKPIRLIENLKYLTAKKILTVTKMANILDLSPQQIYRYLSGENEMAISKVVILSDFLDVGVDKLIFERISSILKGEDIEEIKEKKKKELPAYEGEDPGIQLVMKSYERIIGLQQEQLDSQSELIKRLEAEVERYYGSNGGGGGNQSAKSMA